MANASWWRAPWFRRVAISSGLLGAVALWVEPQAIMAQVHRLSPGWVLVALLISVFQVMLSAWRWQLTARLIQVPMRFSYALREYYLALLVNQLLPGGVLGDAGRAHRHARQSASTGGAWRAVIIERVSGQVALALLTLVALLLSPLWHAALGSTAWLAIGGAVALAVGVMAVALTLSRRQGPLKLPGWYLAISQDIQRGLLSAGVWPLQLLSSLAIVASYGVVMVCAARAIGVELPALSLLALAPVVLLAMLVPFSVAGWGVREGAAAGIWMWVGLPAAQGVAVSLAYGVVVLLASLPGLWVAITRRHSALPPESGRAQHNIEQRVVSAAEGAQGRAQRTVQRLDRRHLQTGAAGADEQRGDQQVQPVDDARFDKLGDGDTAAFHQNTRQLARLEQGDHVAGHKPAMAIQWQHAVFYRPRCGGLGGIRPHHMQCGCGSVLKQLAVHGHPATRVEYHSSGVATADVAHGQLRVIGIGCPRTDHHRVGQRPQPVQVHQAFPAVDVVRVAALCRDPAVEALPQLRHYPTRRGRQGREATHRLASVFGHRFPVGDMACQQSPPDIVLNDIRTFLGVGHDASALNQPLHHAMHGDPAQASLARHASQPGGFHVSH